MVVFLRRRLSLKALIPVWLAAFALLAVFVSPMTFATGVLLLMIGLVIPAVTILLWKDQQPPTVAEVLNRTERSATKR
jgi:hypothetical protein